MLLQPLFMRNTLTFQVRSAISGWEQQDFGIETTQQSKRQTGLFFRPPLKRRFLEVQDFAEQESPDQIRS